MGVLPPIGFQPEPVCGDCPPTGPLPPVCPGLAEVSGVRSVPGRRPRRRQRGRSSTGPCRTSGRKPRRRSLPRSPGVPPSSRCREPAGALGVRVVEVTAGSPRRLESHEMMALGFQGFRRLVDPRNAAPWHAAVVPSRGAVDLLVRRGGGLPRADYLFCSDSVRDAEQGTDVAGIVEALQQKGDLAPGRVVADGPLEEPADLDFAEGQHHFPGDRNRDVLRIRSACTCGCARPWRFPQAAAPCWKPRRNR